MNADMVVIVCGCRCELVSECGKTGIAATELPLHMHLDLKLAGPLCATI
jgi:hypothetical protein